MALLVNSITPMGNDWWLKGLIVKYRLVQNIPLGFFDSSKEFDPTTLFSEGYFEWEHIAVNRRTSTDANFSGE